MQKLAFFSVCRKMHVFNAPLLSFFSGVDLMSVGYPEPVYALEKEVTPRQRKRVEIRRKRANMYRIM